MVAPSKISTANTALQRLAWFESTVAVLPILFGIIFLAVVAQRCHASQVALTKNKSAGRLPAQYPIIKKRSSSVTRCRLAGRNVLRVHVESEQESICALELESVRAVAIGLQLIRHHDEAVVARCSPVLHVFEHRRFIRHALKAFQFDLSGLAAVDRRMRLV